jgi:hypothetical protein
MWCVSLLCGLPYAHYCYQKRSSDGNEGMYCHMIIQEVINKQWFSNRKDEGVKYVDIYNPFPKVAVALILAAVRP